MMTQRRATALAWAIIVIAILLVIICGCTGCGYVSGVGLTYDPNSGVIGGQVTFPVGADYKQAHPPKHRHHKTTSEYK